ncbi:MAG: DedA family protein [Proteobacteria bacterium]|nr:DedA family protein [Desulfobulbaceae bacterium]MBU4153248.1 DedA family protein [Pseudomonadota bacterium]
MEALLISHGAAALFCLSFLAATIFPLGSEWLLITLITKELPVSMLVTTATVGNVLGACTTYAIGMWGSTLLINKALRLEQNTINQAMTAYKRYGSWSLLFSWLPIIGDALCLAAGLLKLNFPRFALLVTLGKLGRYAGIAAITVNTMS